MSNNTNANTKTRLTAQEKIYELFQSVGSKSKCAVIDRCEEILKEEAFKRDENSRKKLYDLFINDLSRDQRVKVYKKLLQIKNESLGPRPEGMSTADWQNSFVD